MCHRYSPKKDKKTKQEEQKKKKKKKERKKGLKASHDMYPRKKRNYGHQTLHRTELWFSAEPTPTSEGGCIVVLLISIIWKPTYIASQIYFYLCILIHFILVRRIPYSKKMLLRHRNQARVILSLIVTSWGLNTLLVSSPRPRSLLPRTPGPQQPFSRAPTLTPGLAF